MELVHVIKHKSCHLLLLIRMSLDVQSAPIETVVPLCEKEKRKKYFHKKEFPETVVLLLLGRFVVCDRRAARQAQIVARLVSWLQHTHKSKDKSCHLHRRICMSFDTQSPSNKTRLLCARKGGEKEFHEKEFSEKFYCCLTCRLRSTCSTTSADRCKAGITVAAHTYNKEQVLPPASADLHVV